MIKTLIALALIGAVADGCETTPPPDDTPITAPALPKPTKSTGRTQAPVLVRDCVVSRVVDGDTLKLKCEVTGAVTVRVIGINTPETVAPGKPVACFGPQATAEAKRLLPAGREVRIQADPTQALRDRYERVLAYVSMRGADYGQQMIRMGFAREYTYSKPYLKRSEYRRAQTRAQAGQLGLWGAC